MKYKTSSLERKKPFTRKRLVSYHGSYLPNNRDEKYFGFPVVAISIYQAID